MVNDNIQHGIDDNPSGDAEKGAALGGLGGAAVGAAAGSLAGPLGTVVGAIAGGLLGAGASGAAVAAIDEVDNDNTVSGLGDGASYVGDDRNNIRSSTDDTVVGAGVGGHNVVTGEPATSEAGNGGLATGAIAGGLIGTVVGGPVGAVVGGTLGSLAGGVAGDAAEASSERPTAAYTGDTNYPGAALLEQQPGIAADVTALPGNSTRVNDDVLSPSTQTDYRNVDTGVTSIGGTDANADVSGIDAGTDLSGTADTGVPGVRSGNTGADNNAEDPIINWSGAHGETLNESKRIESNETGGETSAPR
jgi:outer membrane lipoprotein SlyB